MAVGSQTRIIDTEAGTVKLVLVDSQNISKLVSGKVTSSAQRYSMNLGVNHGNAKGDTSLGKMPRQRKRPGTILYTVLVPWNCICKFHCSGTF